MARFAKPLQGPFGLAAKHSQKHKNRPKIGRFSHFNPSAEMHPFSPFSASKAPEKWLCDAICRKKQLFAGSFVSRSHSFCSFTFSQISETADEIRFQRIGHYDEAGPGGSASSSPYTETCEVKLVNTENGWRFAGFAMAY